MISSEIREDGERVGFQLEDISTHRIGILAHSRSKSTDAPIVSKYQVNIFEIERIGVAAIRNAANEADVIIIDEIGPMELKSAQFVLAVELALASKKTLIGTIHRHSAHQLVSSIKSNPNYRIIEIDLQNRARVPFEILDETTG